MPRSGGEPGARRHAGGRAAIAVDHRRRRHRRCRHRGASFRYGLVHHGMRAIDVLLGDGHIVTCTPDNEHRDLFFGLPELVRHSRLCLEDHRPATCRSNGSSKSHTSGITIATNTSRSWTAVLPSRGGLRRRHGIRSRREVRHERPFVEVAPGTSDYSFERSYFRSIREQPQRLP